MSGQPIPVKPSGGDDTARIQAVLDDYNVALLSGSYNITGTLYMGREADWSKMPPAIIATNGATLNYVGDAMNNYAIRCVGFADPIYYFGQPFTRISGIAINCDHKCRGVMFSSQIYGATLADGLMINQPRYVGLDVIDCWASILRHAYVTHGLGYAARFYRFNSGRVQNCRFQSWGCYDKDNKGVNGYPTDTRTIARYAMENGMAAAAAQYPSDYEESWPASDETIVPKWYGTSGSYTTVKPSVAVSEKCGVLFDLCSNSTIDNMMLESMASVDYPAVRLMYPTANTFCGLRFEAALARTLIEINGNATPTGATSFFGGNSFDCILATTGQYSGSTIYPWSVHDQVVKLMGYTKNNEFTNITANGCQEAFVTFDGGNHVATKIERCNGLNEAAPLSREINTPTVSGTIEV